MGKGFLSLHYATDNLTPALIKNAKETKLKRSSLYIASVANNDAM